MAKKTKGGQPGVLKEDVVQGLLIEAEAPRHWQQYSLLDSGGGQKLERFGNYVLIRPEPQAIWQPRWEQKDWEKRAHAIFEQEGSHKGRWVKARNIPDSWGMDYSAPSYSLKFRLALTQFKHVGLFPEQAANWDWAHEQCLRLKDARVLNLFAYTGAATLAARAGGGMVTHVDAIKQVVNWAKKNQELNELDRIRWIVDDAVKFVEREIRRGSLYEGIMLDPPAFGHGAKGERWKLEEQLDGLLSLLKQLLNPERHFLLLNVYSLGLSPLVLDTLMRQHFGQRVGNLRVGELYLEAESGQRLPTGVYARMAS